MSELKKGDVFSMEEGDGEKVVWRHKQKFKAVSDPYIPKFEDQIKDVAVNVYPIWTINVEPYNGWWHGHVKRRIR